MAYAGNVRSTLGASASVVQLFKANSGYSVFSSYNVYGWNDMFDFYTRAFVLGGRFSARISVANTDSLLVSSSVTTTTSLPTTAWEAAGAGRSTFAIATSGGPAISVHSEWDVAEVLTKAKIVDDPELACFKAASPTDQIYQQVTLTNSTGTTATYNMFFLIELTVVFTDPVPILS